MWGLICEPSPSMNRPLEKVWRSLASTAVLMGLRAKATAIPVPSSIRSVCSAASRRGRNGSWPVSARPQAVEAVLARPAGPSRYRRSGRTRYLRRLASAHPIPAAWVRGTGCHPESVAQRWLVAHNSRVTDDATDGRPWPIDPIITPPAAGPLPVPESVVVDGMSDPLAGLSDSVNGDTPTLEIGTPPLAQASPAQGSTPVSDDDRTAYGVLLDRAAERGLLSQYDYELRLGELAAATSIDQMQQIVTELPVFTAPPPSATAHRSRRTGPDVALATVRGRRRSSPWVLLAIMVVVVLASLVFFAIYAEHLVRNHNAGLVSTPVAVRAFSALRL